MKVHKLSVSFEADLGERVRDAARHAGCGLSSWLAGAADARLRSEALAKYLAAWERKHGALTAGELARAEGELGVRAVRKASR